MITLGFIHCRLGFDLDRHSISTSMLIALLEAHDFVVVGFCVEERVET